MGSSWGHQVRRLTQDEITRAVQHDEHSAELFARPDYRYDSRCRMPKCQEPVSHQIRYSYVTGRAGRVSWAAKDVCGGHAEKFAAKHGTEITDAPAPEHAVQQAVRAAFAMPASQGSPGAGKGQGL